MTSTYSYKLTNNENDNSNVNNDDDNGSQNRNYEQLNIYMNKINNMNQIKTKHIIKRWFSKPIVDANGMLVKVYKNEYNNDYDDNYVNPYTREDYLNDFYDKICHIINLEGFNINSTKKLKDDLALFIYNYSQ